MDPRRLLLLACMGAFTGGFPRALSAQETPTPEDGGLDTAGAPPAPAGQPDDQRVHAPVLVDFVEAAYPPAAAAERIEGSVVLKLHLDSQGLVIEAEVQTGAGHGFDEAALAAARQFRFEPARRGSIPVSARILYTYEFQLPPEGAITGTVLVPDAPSDDPVVGATVLVEGPDGQRHTARTDTDGRFHVAGLTPGSYSVRAQAQGIGRIQTDVSVADDQVAEAVLRLLPSTDQKPIEVTVWGSTDVDRLRRSSQAVQVVELDNEQREASDLGEVLARSEGIGVRRTGGIGSATQFSLNGLTGDQVRFFLDGVPLEFAGYPFDVSNVPVNLIERVEVYRGVVPIRFGADALGGGVNLVTEQDLTGTRGSLWYQAGSFDTQRVSAMARHRHDATGFFVRATGFFDTTRNDYRIDVETTDERGRLSPATVHRFHDSYRAGGANLEVGIVDKPWADRFIVRGFATGFDNEVQHNVVMTVPYGEVNIEERSAGASIRYDNAFSDRLAVSLIGGYARNRIGFLDVATCVYDWFGQCNRERPIGGEIEPIPRDQVVTDDTFYSRLNVAWRVKPAHTLRFSVAPTRVSRRGEDRAVASELVDPLSARRDLFTMVSGIEWELNLVDGKLQNTLFAKNYLQLARSEEPLPGGAFRDLRRDTNRFGIGNGLRYQFFDWLYAKASYEFATRLPGPEEVFGNGALIVPNLSLAPEVSHNANLGYTLDLRATRSGAWRMDVNTFLREVDQLIVLLGNDRLFSHQNVFDARSIGIEGSAGWTMKDEWLSIDANATYQSVRNTASEGTFGDFEGDRVPNQPYLFANGITRFQAKGIGARNDVFTMAWYLRYVHSFFRTWESAGIREFKDVVPSQLLNTVAVTYVLRAPRTMISFTGQVENIGNRQAFDFFGVQRPGRAFFFVISADLFTPSTASSGSRVPSTQENEQ